jgi:FMN-dependent NADH-azoreductase
LAGVQFALQITTDVAVQARDGLIAFEKEFHEKQVPVISAAVTLAQNTAAWQTANEPLLKNVRWVKRVLVAIAALLALGGVSVGAVAWNFNWVIKTALKAYLDLPLSLP